VADLLPREQPPDDVHTFLEAVVADLLARPRISGDPLVRCLARAEGGPDPLWVHRSRESGRLCVLNVSEELPRMDLLV
jgi:hypothetical protein